MNVLFYSGGTTVSMIVDINGIALPNVLGKDAFTFIAADLRLVAYGKVDWCNIAKTVYVNNGKGCTAWVIYKGNLDYLRRDVSSEWPTN